MDDDGAASALAFVSAGLLFLGVVGIVLTVMVHQIPPPTAAQGLTAGHELEARNILERFVASQGTMAYNPNAALESDKGWEDSPADRVPGLLNGLGRLSLAKVNDLTQPRVVNSHLESDPTDATPGKQQLRYSEAKHQLSGFLQRIGDVTPCDKLHSDFQVRFEFADGSVQVFGPDPPPGAILVPAKATLHDSSDRAATVLVLVFDPIGSFGLDNC